MIDRKMYNAYVFEMKNNPSQCQHSVTQMHIIYNFHDIDYSILLVFKGLEVHWLTVAQALLCCMFLITVLWQVEMVYGLLSMFSSGDRDDMSRTLLAMSSSPDSCVAMRQSGCLPLLIQVLGVGSVLLVISSSYVFISVMFLVT